MSGSSTGWRLLWGPGARAEGHPALAVPSPTGHSPKRLVMGSIDRPQRSKWWTRARAQPAAKGGGGRHGAGDRHCCIITGAGTDGPRGGCNGVLNHGQGRLRSQRDWAGIVLTVPLGAWQIFIEWLLKLCVMKKCHKFIISSNIYIPVPPTQTNRQWPFPRLAGEVTCEWWRLKDTTKYMCFPWAFIHTGIKSS